ncbi:carbonyl reductase [Delitschia confertaspora ATCC 74209]|uniref:Carbonyl reductase n=1 Tax=Delitschia confertaspora ATCC 74209 TaxID=1513339 RepID=A0A9P4MVF4_9PLEO|nr:carbonyl reductase [Delitschia confertaspora ATCC 74209]
MPTPQPVALITGANQGIGLATARALARDYGYHIFLGSRNPQNGQQAASALQLEGLSVEPLTIDITSDESIIRAATEVEEKYGYIDVLINNAGICIDGVVSDFRTLYQQTFDTNVIGSAAVTEAFIPLLSNSVHLPPRIVFISSTLGSLSVRATPGNKWANTPLSAYRCSKAALNMVCLNYAARLNEMDWKVNACCPGSVATNINGYYGKDAERCPPNILRLATLGIDGETGMFSDEEGVVGW